MHTGIEFHVMAALIHLIEIIRYSFFSSRNKTLRLFEEREKKLFLSSKNNWGDSEHSC